MDLRPVVVSIVGLFFSIMVIGIAFQLLPAVAGDLSLTAQDYEHHFGMSAAGTFVYLNQGDEFGVREASDVSELYRPDGEYCSTPLPNFDDGAELRLKLDGTGCKEPDDPITNTVLVHDTSSGSLQTQQVKTLKVGKQDE